MRTRPGRLRRLMCGRLVASDCGPHCLGYALEGGAANTRIVGNPEDKDLRTSDGQAV